MFKRHGLSQSDCFQTWTTYRKQIEAEFIEIITVIKTTLKVDKRNIFAVGFSNGGYWASFLAARKHVNAGASHYVVWTFPNHNGSPANSYDADKNSVIAIHGGNDSVQNPKQVYPQLKIVGGRRPRFKKHLVECAGHRWDCKPCRKDGYDADTTKKALKLTLDFNKANRK